MEPPSSFLVKCKVTPEQTKDYKGVTKDYVVVREVECEFVNTERKYESPCL